MKTLGNYYHDFPSLAKQTGYFFHLYRGKVNWNELENLNLDDITESRNFQLLEQNLMNVINCNLEREYDLKILDKNLVKLFKLAQLGIDYLSFCEQYLDKCVILLQEKLIAFKEKCEFLKQENDKKTEELKRRKKRNSNSNYQCEKCEKFFISEFYLKGHDKRRHSNPTTPNISARKYSANKHHTSRSENKMRKLSPILTLTEKQNDLENYNIKESKQLECDNLIKIKNLEKNVEKLENRMIKAEIASLKTNQNTIHSFPCSQLLEMFYSQILSNTTSCFSHPEVCCSKKNQHSYLQHSFPNHFVFTGSSNLKLTNLETVIPENLQRAHLEFKNNENTKKEEKETEKAKEELKPKEIFLNKGRVIAEQEIEDNSSKNCSTLAYQTPKINEKFTSPTTNSEAFLSFQAKNYEIQKFDKASTSNDSLGPNEEQTKKLMHNVEMEEIEPPNNIIEDVSQSDYKLVKKKNQKSFDEQNFSKNLKKSLTGISNLVFSNYPHLNSRQKEVENKKSIAEDQLRNSGVDPEWSNFSRKTMIQSINSLKQQQKFLTKKNSMYPTIRRTLEKWIFRKLREKHENFEENRIKKQINIEGEKSENNKCKVTFDHSLVNLESPKKKKKPKQKHMYDIETESESDLEI